MENISDLLNYLSAPRHNTIWSWGSVRQVDGAVFLLVWTDEVKSIEGKIYTGVLGPSGHGPGYNERIKHVEMIRDGAPSYLIYCTARDVKADPRAIGHFNNRTLFRGGSILNKSMDGIIRLEQG